MTKIQTSPYKTFGQVKTFSIRYISNNHWVEGFLALPESRDEPLPCIIFNRGGSFDFASINDSILENHIAQIASWGYVVIASQYSGNGGSEGADEFGGADLADILCFKDYLADFPEADASRIGMIGGSRGGQMVYQSCAAVNWLKAGVSIAGATNLDRQIVLRPEMAGVFDRAFGNTAEGRKERSAINWIDKFCKTTPLLIMHGTSDWRVSPHDSIELSAKLIDNKVPHRLVLFEGADHGISEFREEKWRFVKEWFDRFVRSSQSLPDLNPHGK